MTHPLSAEHYLQILAGDTESIPAQNSIYKLLRDPDNSDSPDMNVAGTLISPVGFQYVVPSRMIFKYARMNLSIQDTDIRPSRFGGIGALTSGCIIRVANSDDDDSTVLDFTNGEPIKANREFTLLVGVDVPFIDAANEDWLPIRFTINRGLGGKSMILTEGQKIQFIIQDDLTNLEFFRVMVQGYLEAV